MNAMMMAPFVKCSFMLFRYCALKETNSEEDISPEAMANSS